MLFEKDKGRIKGKGPIAKFFSEKAILELCKICSLSEEDSVFFSCDLKKNVEKISGLARDKLGKALGIVDKSKFEFCWIVDFPMYKYDEKEKKIDFSHNPFSMPQVNLSDFEKSEPLSISKRFLKITILKKIQTNSNNI